MIDLVKRLRIHQKADGRGLMMQWDSELCGKAADRIKELEDALERSGINGLKRRIDELERLVQNSTFEWASDWVLYDSVRGINQEDL